MRLREYVPIRGPEANMDPTHKAVRRMWMDLLREDARSDKRLRLVSNADVSLMGQVTSLIAGCDSIFVLWEREPKTNARHDEGLPMGFVAVESYVAGQHLVTSEYLEVKALYIEPGFRRHGHGAMLLRRANQWAEENGHDDLLLFVSAQNANALVFYDGVGFEPLQQVLSRKVEM